VPLALFGALVFTFLKFAGPPGLTFPLTEGWTTTLNIYSQVGLVTLVGLVAKNAILIVEFANKEQLLGASKLDAVRAAARTRLRPILMTTTATICGHFPLTLVTGPGAVARNSIGIVLVGGMAIGSLFTLFVVPSLYVLLAALALSPDPNPSSSWSPEAASGAKRDGSKTDGTTRAREAILERYPEPVPEDGRAAPIQTASLV
jgi:multidrug efflux pump subunit AcrB